MNGHVKSVGYADRLEAFKRSDAEREALVAELVKNYQELQIKYEDLSDDLSNERESRRLWQSKARANEQTLAEHKQASGSNSFAVCILDGDGAIFSDYLWNMGQHGGAEAAHLLHTELKTNLKATYPDAIVDDWTIVVQVILNLQGLSAKLHACGIVMSPNEVLGFGRAFGSAHPMFCFIDAGAGKERADHKIRETLRLYLPMAQCKHVFFGPSHDNGYIVVLERYRREYASKLTLVETRPAEPGFLELGLQRVKFPKIFRSDNLPSRPAMSVNTVASPAPPSRSHSGVQMQPTSAVFVPNVPSVPSMSKSPSPAPSADSAASSSWATVGKANGSAKTINIAPTIKKPSPRRCMLFSVHEERIDQPLPNSDPAAEKRFDARLKSKGKCCNEFHLKGHCPAGEYCDYVHGERLTPGEQLVLKHKARSLTCGNRPYCDDIDCYKGHHCKFGKSCMISGCYFSDTHGMDLKPAKKTFDDGTVEWLMSYFNGAH